MISKPARPLTNRIDDSSVSSFSERIIDPITLSTALCLPISSRRIKTLHHYRKVPLHGYHRYFQMPLLLSHFETIPKPNVGIDLEVHFVFYICVRRSILALPQTPQELEAKK